MLPVEPTEKRQHRAALTEMHSQPETGAEPNRGTPIGSSETLTGRIRLLSGRFAMHNSCRIWARPNHFRVIPGP